MHMSAKRFNAQLRRSRMALFFILLPLAVTSGGLLGFVQPALRLIYIVLGFSLIIFLHELGHFVVARLCSVKCLAFSIGIGPRLCGWRKHGKLSFGADPYDRESEKAKPADQLPPEQSHQNPHPVSGVQSDLPTTAHVPPHPPVVGDCDYRISWLPLGGYVRMLGQDDMDPTKISNDPNSFNRRPIWQRMCIVSAGVIMNLIFAAVCFSIIFSPGIGVGFPPAVVGQVWSNMPAWKNLHVGDQILSINSQQPRGFLEFTDLQMEAALSDGSTPVHLAVKRADTGIIEDVPLVPKRSDTGLLAFGVESIPGTKIADTGSDYTDPDYVTIAEHQSASFAQDLSQYAKIRKGDRIVAIDGKDLPDSASGQYPYLTMYNHLKDVNGKPVTLTLANADATMPKQDITVTPRLVEVPGSDFYPTVLGLSPRTATGKAPADSPAAGKLQDGDVVLLVGSQKDPTVKQMIDAIRANPNMPVQIKVDRALAAAPATSPATAPGAAAATPPASPVYAANTFAVTPQLHKGIAQLGVPVFQLLSSPRFIPPTPDSPIGMLNLSEEATIAAIDDHPVRDWQEIYSQLRSKEAGKPVKITFSDAGKQVSASVDLSKDDADAVNDMLTYHLGLRLENETRDQVAKNAGDAVMMGLDHTKKFILNVYMTLGGLFRGTVPADNLHGIVGITKVGYDVQERGRVWLWYVLALVSVNLAVANFLPLPIVDGGLFLLLILEKIRGKPLSLKVQTAIQTVGIVLLAGLFLFVTYNDITGMFMK